MRILLLSLALMCFAVLSGGSAVACPQMAEASAAIEQATPSVAMQHHGGHEAQSATGQPCHHGSGSPTCGELHACCAIPALKTPHAALHRWPTRVSYAPRPPANVHAAPTTALDRPPKMQA